MSLLLSSLLLAFVSVNADGEAIVLPREPALSPDGATLVFAWQRDLWRAPTNGGDAERLTLHPANDSRPVFSPDGRWIAFSSDRSGGTQIHVVSVDGGATRQVTHGSIGKRLLGFTPDGQGLVVIESTDLHFSRTESARVFILDLEGKAPKRPLFDAGVSEAALSPDGSKVLFTRGRAAWSRKGYRGPAALQLWVADLSVDPPTLERLDADRDHFQNVSCMSPMWAPDSKGYYYLSDPEGPFDLYYRELGSAEVKQITDVGQDRSDDGLAYARLSADGRTMVARRRFDLHRIDLTQGTLQPIPLHATGDQMASAQERRVESSANDVAFTDDGKQIAFVSGEDLYVMDRILREPRRVTHTPHQESSPLFNADGSRLFFVTDSGGEIDIWEATHDHEDGVWWLADAFTLRQVTNDRDVESSLQPSPAGGHIAYLKGSNLFVMDDDGSDHRQVVEAWSPPSFDWAPDGRWIVYATQDSDYNNDVYVVPVDGTRDPYNLSRHPDRDSSPAWSRDGSRIAFVSRRDGEESDIYYINLTNEEEELTARDRKLEEALAAMKKGGKSGKGGGANRGGRGGPGAGDDQETPTEESEGDEGQEASESEDSDLVEIDFEGIHDRLHRISIPDSQEGGLIWSPDGKKLAFFATIDGESGLYSVEFPEVGSPKKMASQSLSRARWLASTKEIVGLSSAGGGRRFGGFGGGGGQATPAAMDGKGSIESFGFSVRRVRDWTDVRQVSFDQAWRAMRDRFYDPAMNNRDWEAIRKKYRPIAAQCLGATEFSEMMNMMLGELNASHMGHRGGSDPLPRSSQDAGWAPTTYHLGLRFAPADEKPGREVASVIPGGPCHRERSRVEVGDVVLAIDGQALDANTNLEALLTLEEERDLTLRVADTAGNERDVTVRPVRSVAGLLYDEWVEQCRAEVERLSDGTLGYLHIRGMNMPSFRQMEEDLYHAGHGKEGLIIDVRFNGGGSTTDHVLTALTQPVHAITKSRGSGEGYPQDRKIYASWSKPIVVMCNEHSFSNAEILAHAVKQIGRGQLVGMRTAGGVISTGGVGLLDGSSVRMPMRGWYLSTTGEDMELNGCEPDHCLWNPPGGDDTQLQTAITTLIADVKAEKAKGAVKIEPAATKRLRESTGR